MRGFGRKGVQKTRIKVQKTRNKGTKNPHDSTCNGGCVPLYSGSSNIGFVPL